MARRATTSLLFTAVAALAAAPAEAHELDANETFTVPIPTDPLTGSVLFATLIGPEAPKTVVHARLDLTFESLGTPGSDVRIELGVMVDQELEWWTVTGADLGWGSGTGTFTGSIETEDLYGQVWPGFFGTHSIIELRIDSVTGPAWGKFTQSGLTLTLNESLVRDSLALTLSSGGTQTLFLDAGPGHAGELHLVVGSLSGVTPGTVVGGKLLPLNADGYTVLTATQPNGPFLPDSLGTLDAAGKATVHFTLPPGTSPALAGLTAHHAYVLVGGGAAITFTSNPVTLELVP